MPYIVSIGKINFRNWPLLISFEIWRAIRVNVSFVELVGLDVIFKLFFTDILILNNDMQVESHAKKLHCGSSQNS